MPIFSECNPVSERISHVDKSQACQNEEKMDSEDSENEINGGGEVRDALGGSTPASPISEISPGLSRFLLHISDSSPPSSTNAQFLENGE